MRRVKESLTRQAYIGIAVVLIAWGVMAGYVIGYKQNQDVCPPQTGFVGFDLSEPNSGVIVYGDVLGIETPVDQPWIKIETGTLEQLTSAWR